MKTGALCCLLLLLVLGLSTGVCSFVYLSHKLALYSQVKLLSEECVHVKTGQASAFMFQVTDSDSDVRPLCRFSFVSANHGGHSKMIIVEKLCLPLDVYIEWAKRGVVSGIHVLHDPSDLRVFTILGNCGKYVGYCNLIAFIRAETHPLTPATLLATLALTLGLSIGGVVPLWTIAVVILPQTAVALLTLAFYPMCFGVNVPMLRSFAGAKLLDFGKATMASKKMTWYEPKSAKGRSTKRLIRKAHSSKHVTSNSARIITPSILCSASAMQPFASSAPAPMPIESESDS